MMRYFITLLVILHAFIAEAINPSKIDSLESLLKTAKEDTVEIELHIKLFLEYEFADTSIALDHLESTRLLAEKQKNEKWISNYYYYMGWFYDDMGKFPKALKYNELALSIRYRLNDKKGLTQSLSNIGLVYRKQGNYPEALKYQFKGLKIEEELGNKRGISHSLNSIGLLYWNQGNYPEALIYYNKSLKIAQELGIKEYIAYALNNIGLINQHQEDYEEAIKNYLLCIDICKEIGNERVLAFSINNIGNIYQIQRNYNEALQYYNRSLAIHKKTGNQFAIAGALINIASVQLKIGEPSAGEIQSIAEKSYAISKELGSWSLIKESSLLLSNVHVQQKNFKLTFEYYQETMAANDSLFNEDKSKEIGKLEAKYEFEKAEDERERLKNEELRLENEMKQRRDNLQYSAILIFMVMLFTSVFMIGRFHIPIRLAEGIVFFSFLLFFEFTLVLLDPFIDEYSSGAPAIKLAFNAVLAGSIFPLHAFFEKTLKNRIT